MLLLLYVATKQQLYLSLKTVVISNMTLTSVSKYKCETEIILLYIELEVKRYGHMRSLTLIKKSHHSFLN